MTATDPPRFGRIEGEVLHGGARRLSVNWVHCDVEPPAKVAWYLVRPGERCGLHIHSGKTECWLVIGGSGTARIGDRTWRIGMGDAVTTGPGRSHALENDGDEDLVFVNVAVPTGDGPVTTTEIETAG